MIGYGGHPVNVISTTVFRRVGGGIVGHLTFRLNLVQARKMLKAMELTEGWARPWGLCTQSLELQK